MKMPLRRGLLWGFLVAALVVVAAATLLQRMWQPEPLPVYGKLPPFSLVNRDGWPVRLEDLAGKAWVADFIFTRCPASCPMMSARMARLDRSLSRDLPRDLDVLLVSISVDPAYDTPEVLERYAKKFQAPGRWLFLTGKREDVRRLCVEGFKLGLDMDPPLGNAGPEPILHSTRFVLVDGEGQIRGYYEAFDEASTEKLRSDLLRLSGPLS